MCHGRCNVGDVVTGLAQAGQWIPHVERCETSATITVVSSSLTIKDAKDEILKGVERTIAQSVDIQIQEQILDKRTNAQFACEPLAPVTEYIPSNAQITKSGVEAARKRWPPTCTPSSIRFPTQCLPRQWIRESVSLRRLFEEFRSRVQRNACLDTGFLRSSLRAFGRDSHISNVKVDSDPFVEVRLAPRTVFTALSVCRQPRQSRQPVNGRIVLRDAIVGPEQRSRGAASCFDWTLVCTSVNLNVHVVALWDAFNMEIRSPRKPEKFMDGCERCEGA